MKILNELLGYKNLKLFQETTMFSFSLDSILLSRFINFGSSVKNICDFGTNNAVIPILISKYTNAEIDAVEIQKLAVEIALENVLLNNLEKQISILNEDIKEFIKTKNNKYDLIICNPPFFKVGPESKLNKKSDLLIAARHETKITLEEIIRSAAIGCKQKGKFVMIHLAERTDEIITILNNNNFKVKRIQFIYSRQGEEAKKIIIDSSYQGNEGVKILEPLYIHENESDDYTLKVKEMFED